MTLNQIASKIAKLEGKKSQARIGDIREILKILVDNNVNTNLPEESFLQVLCDLAYKKWQENKDKKTKKAKKNDSKKIS